MRFLDGSQNFGLDTEQSDRDFFQILFPQLGDLCKPIPSTKETKNEDGSITKNIDIRSIPSLFFKSNLDIIQLLYSKEVVDGGCLEEYFRKYENELSTMNIPRLYQSVMGSALNRYKRKTSKDLAHIIFGFKTLIQFEEQNFTDLRKCFEHNENDLYRAIRSESYDNWLISAQEWERLALEKKETYMSICPNEEFKEKLENDIGALIIQQMLNQNEKWKEEIVLEQCIFCQCVYELGSSDSSLPTSLCSKKCENKLNEDGKDDLEFFID